MGFLSNLFGGNKGGKNKQPRVDIGKRFDLLNRTGQGSMSKVWRARDRNLGRVICLKLLDRVKTKEFEARFPGIKKPSEGAICMLLRHKNIVQTFEHGLTKEGDPYLVMELIEGMSFNYLVENRSDQLNDHRIDYLIQMSDAIEYLHQQGFLHRDICPRNVMVTRDHQVKLIDFGLTIPNTYDFCKPGNRTGTPNYLAPEIIRRVTTDLRVDLFALGVTAYEVFTHELPWEKTQSLQTLLSHINTVGRDPRDFKPKMDEKTAKFLIKAIDRNPRERFQNAAEFRDALRTLPKQ